MEEGEGVAGGGRGLGGMEGRGGRGVWMGFVGLLKAVGARVVGLCALFSCIVLVVVAACGSLGCFYFFRNCSTRHVFRRRTYGESFVYTPEAFLMGAFRVMKAPA